MPQDDVLPDQDPDLHKKESARQNAEFRRLLSSTACELLGGAAQASAEAFEVVNSHVSAEQPNLVQGILKGNARFLEHVSHTMEKVAERFQPRQAAAASEAETPKS